MIAVNRSGYDKTSSAEQQAGFKAKVRPYVAPATELIGLYSAADAGMRGPCWSSCGGSSWRGVVAWIDELVVATPAHPNSYDTNGDWASQHPHAVQDKNGDGNLGAATSVLAKAQPVADHFLVSPDGGFNQASFIVA
jgi:hypothetical protein